jgi:DNA polymerase
MSVPALSDEVVIALRADDDAEGWRRAARRLLAEGCRPERVRFTVADRPGLFDAGAEPIETAPPPLSLPRPAVELVNLAIDHSDPDRFDLLYRLLYRASRERSLIDNPTDTDVFDARRLAKSVRRDIHKMHAFVRFRRLEDDPSREEYVAWFEPDHHIVETVAPFFVRRFCNLRWSIVTPRRSLHWHDGRLTIGDGGRREDLPENDAFEAAWSAYFASIFNPARIKVKAMQAEMPKKYWRNLPETRAIPELLAAAPKRSEAMSELAHHKAAAQADLIGRDELASVPRAPSSIAAALKGCTQCPLYEDATQVVPGEGPERARLFIVGEQPGDMEDHAGRPFVGPAGQLLRDTLAELGIAEEDAYITNAVKHFKFMMRGKRRIHQTPRAGEIEACANWLMEEHATIAPKVTVTLGATALRGMWGKAQKLNAVRGEIFPLRSGGVLVPTVHPAYLLRLPDKSARDIETARFRADLTRAQDLLADA